MRPPRPRPPSSSMASRSALLEEEFKEDERLFNPYARTPPAPSMEPVLPVGAAQPSHPHASGLLRLPANVDLTLREGDRPVVVVRPSQVRGERREDERELKEEKEESFPSAP